MTQYKLHPSSGLVKFLLDFCPLLLFFLAYKLPVEFWIFKVEKPVIFATFVLVISTLLSVLIARILRVKLDKFNIYSTVAVVVFGGFTVIFNDEQFIKIKISIINALFGIALVVSNLLKKPVLKSIFAGKIEMKDEKSWFLLSWRFAFFFLFVAILNEIIWRNFSTDFWVNYKVFAVVPVTLVFMILQIPFIAKHAKPFNVK